MSSASTSMSKRAPKAEASRWRRAAQPSSPSSASSSPAPAKAAQAARAGEELRLERERGEDRGAAGANQRDAVGEPEARVRMEAAEPGQQHRAGERE